VGQKFYGGKMTLPAWAQYRLDEARLTGQTHLDLGGAGQRERLTEFPRQVFNLQNLETLYLTNNKIRFLPDDIELLQKLAVLRLRNNQLSKLPDSLLELNNLRLLDIGFNAFSSFPTVICSLKNLKHLDITGNDLKEIPSRLLDLRSLEGIDWEPNPIVTPPPEIMKKGVPAIKKYFQQLKNGEDTLYEAKLLILGEGGAGKTTLARKIKNPSALLFQEQKSTEGIDVLHWSFPTNQEKNFQVNIWDFGGQEIYHTTHQFFLTKRSLYVLVADTRAEDTDFYYWLNAVQLLSDNSPLLIVKNEKQDRHREINERQLKGEFGNIKDVLSTNLSTNRGLDNVIKSIKYYISNLPHIGTKLP
jgi:GTPase SAR1 family protein